MAKLLLSLLCLSQLLTGCAGISIVDERSYLDMADHMKTTMREHGLPADRAEAANLVTDSSTPYGQILFSQLSPDFMQGRSRTYYLGETFKETLQPRRSTLTPGKTSFTIDHLTQRVTVSMLAVCDWDQDGEKEWLVSCKVLERRGGTETTWYLLVPTPRERKEVLHGTAVALWDCRSGSCSLITTGKNSPDRRDEKVLPPTVVEEFRPGEHSVTTPEEIPAPANNGPAERSL